MQNRPCHSNYSILLWTDEGKIEGRRRMTYDDESLNHAKVALQVRVSPVILILKKIGYVYSQAVKRGTYRVSVMSTRYPHPHIA